MKSDSVSALLKLYFTEAEETELQRIADRIVELGEEMLRDVAPIAK
ncbi:MAG TPA: hypothetical protein PKA10_18825 [Selenomonadales bacterium]|nr:hypothetical protein [Selenomonadales bacterium]